MLCFLLNWWEFIDIKTEEVCVDLLIFLLFHDIINEYGCEVASASLLKSVHRSTSSFRSVVKQRLFCGHCNCWSHSLESKVQTLDQEALGVDVTQGVVGIDEDHATDFLALQCAHLWSVNFMPSAACNWFTLCLSTEAKGSLATAGEASLTPS